MLSSLPPELVREIIESTVPHTYHSTTYQSRQATLRSLSLVSRQFRAIAQPLLFEIVYLESDARLKRLVETEQDTPGLKELIISPKVSSRALQVLQDRETSLESFIIERFQFEAPFKLGVLVQHPKLRSLQIECPLDYTGCEPFKSLQSLVIDFRTLAHDLRLLLDPQMLPSLRALGLPLIDMEEELLDLQGTNVSRLLPQLETIVVQKELYGLAVDGLLAGHYSRILVDIWDASFDAELTRRLPSLQHLRFLSSRDWTPETMRELWKLIVASGKLETSSLKSIYLDLSLHPTSSESSDLRLEMQHIMEECERGGIELVFEAQPSGDGDYYISRKFWSRQRRRREKE
ncbi:uncharacterized protein JCM6883_003533 [Sporobolomyces salmoneus]|uniref:uncharacterized protein n=1 Tax=Sporobolomyces salmoneus TaxID=183962 RepID=UPI00316E480D